ncbi:pyocin activator PrtN family protein [Pseudomonas sp. 5P_3.1_Bac2]|uniref:pyocin activator PrtN family protein n=1 Tax=Pseudomonas sp. 5P_3.1_Bac2 TaxID=2971617 RepID=UPI0021C62D75|nr:pyocin activator PrtN family protein [Pseudomonas sp. 5P_3.1_Bac2]MCU1718688.1 pyocin activator PrtN family protein [Pseudomonas sp. 5P_3.1_Bac2]
MTSANTTFLLMAQYGGKAVIPLEEVRRDFFSHLTIESFRRKVTNGSIDLVVTALENSQKGHRGVHLNDLVHYIDKQRELALREHQKLHR